MEKMSYIEYMRFELSKVCHSDIINFQMKIWFFPDPSCTGLMNIFRFAISSFQ